MSVGFFVEIGDFDDVVELLLTEVELLFFVDLGVLVGFFVEVDFFDDVLIFFVVVVDDFAATLAWNGWGMAGASTRASTTMVASSSLCSRVAKQHVSR